ncbi:hypothetical protein M413DRAFT_445182 [Hebeloma cylindrosporum]|uniref:REJ domain-containing protein n=1 Tax=Hebeloma cylindrosporum TaxID=76867 RepID=A0A0C3CED0_HEBCY|nr:hypothetical protein M413DRAFT_445182 [Hebeloma cylindrosporum h7]
MRTTALQGFLLLSLATLGVVGQSSSTTLSIHSHVTPSGEPHTSGESSTTSVTVTVSTSRPIGSVSSASGSTTSIEPTSVTSSGTVSVPTSTAPTSTAPASTPTTSAPSHALSVKASIGGLLGMVAIPLIFQL